MIFDSIDWDEANLDQATRRATAEEIEQAIWNADRVFKHRQDPERVLIRWVTDGGRRLVVVAQIVRTDCDPSPHGRRSDDEAGDGGRAGRAL